MLDDKTNVGSLSSSSSISMAFPFLLDQRLIQWEINNKIRDSNDLAPSWIHPTVPFQFIYLCWLKIEYHFDSNFSLNHITQKLLLISLINTIKIHGCMHTINCYSHTTKKLFKLKYTKFTWCRKNDSSSNSIHHLFKI